MMPNDWNVATVVLVYKETDWIATTTGGQLFWIQCIKSCRSCYTNNAETVRREGDRKVSGGIPTWEIHSRPPV